MAYVTYTSVILAKSNVNYEIISA